MLWRHRLHSLVEGGPFASIWQHSTRPFPVLWVGPICRRRRDRRWRLMQGGGGGGEIHQEPRRRSSSRRGVSSSSSTSPASSPSPRQLRSLDEAFQDLKERFDFMSIDVPPPHRRHHHHHHHPHGRGPAMPHPFSKVFPLLTLRQRDHYFKRYRKTTASSTTTNNSTSNNNGASNAASFDDSPPRAAVLVLLCTVNHEPSLVFTRRSPRMSSHAGEIAFPGGHFDPLLDTDLLDTALREAKEELDPVDPRNLEWNVNGDNIPSTASSPHLAVLGPTTSVPSLRGIPVKPFVAALLHQNLEHPISSTFPGDNNEVDLVFTMSIRELLQKETTHELPQNRFGMVHAPLFPTSYGSDIWGLTAFILRPLLHKLLEPVLLLPSNNSNYHADKEAETTS